MTGTPYAAGGIRTTVAATRAATDEQLTSHVARLVAEMRRQGTTTVEIKSGYGLTVHDEARSLAVARQFTEETTFLGAHVVPEGDPAEYVDLVTGPMLDAAKEHARWIDVFCERGAFDDDQARAVLTAGAAAGLRGRLHANQLDLRPGRPARRRARAGRGRPLHLPRRRGRRRAARQRHHRDAAAGRRVLDQAALPGRPPAARRRRPGRARLRLQPRAPASPARIPLCIALAVREMGMTPAEAVHAATYVGAAGARPRRRRRPHRRQAGRPGGARRPEPRAPRLPPRRTARRRDLGGRAARV